MMMMMIIIILTIMLIILILLIMIIMMIIMIIIIIIIHIIIIIIITIVIITILTIIITITIELTTIITNTIITIITSGRLPVRPAWRVCSAGEGVHGPRSAPGTKTTRALASPVAKGGQLGGGDKTSFASAPEHQVKGCVAGRRRLPKLWASSSTRAESERGLYCAGWSVH